MKMGKVFLVGAGPGDIGLMTLKGMEAMKEAEVILYDRLANPKLLEFAPDDCELIYCGKLPDRHTLRQEAINNLLVEKAQLGKRVVRLKGGDPGVFGRVGEEATALAQNHIPFEIVPGISSGIAAPLYAGIPVTHREYAESFAVVTAHDKSADGKPLMDWEGLVRGVDTIAFYMGVGNLPFICESLISHGKSASTPVILIQWGTFGRQKTLEGTLEDIAAKADAANFQNPSIILVGEVIALRGKISWFEKKPLYGRQILLARTSTGQSELAKQLTKQGADVIEFPKWRKEKVPVNQDIFKRIHQYDGMLFTSPESVEDFFKSIFSLGLDVRTLRANFYGSSTKSIRALRERGFLAKLVEEMTMDGELLIVGDNTIFSTDHDIWTTSIKKLDTQYFDIFKRMVNEADLDTVIFPSSAAVTAFYDGLSVSGMNRDEFLNLKVVCMGEKTKRAAATYGNIPNAMAIPPTKQGLMEAVLNG